MQFFVSLQCLLQEEDFLLALSFSGGCVGLTLAVTFHAVELDHLFDTLEVLLLDVELELELGKHELDAGAQVGSIIFNQVCEVRG